MGQSLVKNYLHITFSTKHRVHLIHPPVEAELYSYLGGICNNLDCQPLKIGGHTNHVHILCMLSKNVALAKLLEEVKSHSSKWIKTKDSVLRNFYWQDGYGGFSVSHSGVDAVSRYISSQKQHHKEIPFIDEYKTLLKENGIDFDERYL